jgi:ketosteroid isomerase-like protein
MLIRKVAVLLLIPLACFGIYFGFRSTGVSRSESVRHTSDTSDIDEPMFSTETVQLKPEDPRHKEIKEFVNRYFRTWSEQDMKGYDGCFLPDAVIQYVDKMGGVSTTPRKEFVVGQADYHKNSPVKTTEVPETMEIHLEAKLARVIVYWKLTAGARVDRGYDHFTLIKHDGNWRIVNLVFYNAPKMIGN